MNKLSELKNIWHTSDRPRSTNNMFILDLCGRATLEVDYR